MGLVGLNFGRWVILDHLLNPPAKTYFELAALCDANPARLKDVQAELGDRFTGKTYLSLDEMLTDPEIKVVGLYTGPIKRAELIRKIIRSGRDVMTTKPFELDPEAARSVLEEARELGRVVALNSPSFTLAPDLAKIVEWQKKYDLGMPIAARAEATANYVEKADGGWQGDPLLCPVAPIFRIGIYLLNDLGHFFHQPERVFVQHSRLRTGRATPDHAQVGIRYRNGALVNVFASFCIGDGDYYKNSLVINFERGTVYRSLGPVRTPYPLLTLIGPDEKDQRRVIEEIQIPKESDGYAWADFHAAVQGQPPPNLTSPEQIVEGIRIINALSRAELGDGSAMV